MKKQCTKCKKIKNISEFYKNKKSKNGYNTRCKKCIIKSTQESLEKNLEKRKKWLEDNKEKLKQYNKNRSNNDEYRKKRKEAMREYRKNRTKEQKIRDKESCKRWQKNNPNYKKTKKYKKWQYNYLRKPEVMKKLNNNFNEKMKNNIKFRISITMKGQIYRALKNKKSGRHWEDLVGYTVIDLMNHLESLFKEGMSFENHGEWHIDHKKPQCLFNYTSFEDPEFKKCWALENLQPLWKEENLSKGAKYGNK